MLDEIKAQVEALVAPARHTFWQPRDDRPGAARDLRTAYAPSLLALLSESLGSTSGGGRGGAEKRTRSIIDADGVELWRTITERTQSLWERESGSRFWNGSKHPSDLLKAWLPAFIARMSLELMPDEDRAECKSVLSLLTSWVRTIEAKFDPPRKIEILVACPECDTLRFLDGQGDESFALVAEMSAVTGRTRVVCKACNTVWHSLEEYQKKTAVESSTST